MNFRRKLKNIRLPIFIKKMLIIVICVQFIMCIYYKSLSRVDDSEEQSRLQWSDICVEKRNFVFIKCMKCATETMGTIIRRFGYKRALNFVLPVKNNIYLGWPYIMTKTDYRSSKWPYNIIFEHSVYNYTIMTSLMPNNTVYLTSIREPWRRLVSSYHYFRIAEIGEVPSANFTEYVRNIEKYDRIYRSPEKHKLRSCIADNFSLVKNLQGHCLGMPLGFPEGRSNISNNLPAVQKYIEHLEKQFSLVMIVEYMNESLILLKRLMCWTFQDIIHHVSNKAGNKKYLKKGDNFQIFKNYSYIDFVIYDHFNYTFWKKVKEQGEDFYGEVDQFKLVQMLVNQFCFVEGNFQTYGQFLAIPKSRFNKEFNITSEECSLMNRYLLIDLRKQYDEIERPEKIQSTEKWQEPLRGCSYPTPYN